MSPAAAAADGPPQPQSQAPRPPPPPPPPPPPLRASEEEPWRKKRPRKSRGRGLRTRTGCLTCRKRHKKCDEKQPVCGPCTVSSRHCVFPHDLDAQSALEALTRAPGPLPPLPVSPTAPAFPNGHPIANGLPDIKDHPKHSGPPITSGNPITNGLPTANGHPITSHPHNIRPGHATESTASHSPLSVTAHSPGIVLPPIHDVTGVKQGSLPLQKLSPSLQGLSPSLKGLSPHDAKRRVADTGHLACSPDSIISENWSADFASTQWLGLLANDAAQADSGFSLAPSPAPESSDFESRAKAAISTHVSPALLNGQARLPENLDPESERKAWQSDGDLPLTNHEAVLFRHFAEKCARWLDIFDPHRLFSTYSIRLAIKNPGLMKAMLALSAKHRSKSLGIEQGAPVKPASRSSSQTALSDGEDNEWIRYYYETLHYIREALTYSSYTHSEELLATAVVISAYEMLDESDGTGNWQRHLKGVFWIQRSQDVDGGCGGMRQAVWWAWLRQDIWAAFREKRPCFSFWPDRRDVSELTQHELADRAIYLLSKAVNYSADPRKVPSSHSGNPPDPATAAMDRKLRRDDLVVQMERWKSYLGEQYNTLPTPKGPKDVFTPLWVHPPQFGVALQAHSFAQILITLHGPNTSGLNGFLKMQKTLADAVDTICGIAMELKEPNCQIICAQCLYGAGLCVQDSVRREKIISMMEDCESRVGWAPMATWRDDLRLEWIKADSETP